MVGTGSDFLCYEVGKLRKRAALEFPVHENRNRTY